MVGAVVGISALGMGIDATKDLIKVHRKKKRRWLQDQLLM